MFGSSPSDVPAKVRIGDRKLKGKGYIAEGGFSHVFSVKDTKTKEYFALKRMTCKDQDQLAHAIEEVAVMKRLPPHDNVVALEGIEISHSEKGVSTVDILMQIMKGGRLIDVMKARSKHFSMPELLDIFQCIVNATHHLHSQQPPIAHRDLKIENILLDQTTGVYKVCDFGSCTSKRYECKTEEDIKALTQDIELNTTPTYRAPEMVNPQIGTEVGIEADIWALGCTLYKMAYFKDAFSDGAAAIVTGNYVVPAEPQYPSALHHLLGLCLNVQMLARPTIEILVEHVEMIRSASWTDPTGHVPMSVPLLPPAKSPSQAPPMAEAGAPMTVDAPAASPQGPPPKEVPSAELPSTTVHPAASKPVLTNPHRRSHSLTNKSESSHVLKSQSSDGVSKSRTPVSRQCKSEDSVLGEVKKQSLVVETVNIREALAGIAEQEAELKKQRKSLEARLVQIYDANPEISELASHGLVAPVTSDAPQQVEVASFFNGDHGRGTPVRSRSLSGPRPVTLDKVDRGPRSRVNSEASASDNWPNVILTLDEVEHPEIETKTAGGPQSAPATTNPFLEPVGSQTAGRPGAGHRRSASMVIRPRQQQPERKSPSPSSAGPRSLQPPPPAKPRHKHSQTLV